MADNKLYEVLGVSQNASDNEIKKVSGIISSLLNDKVFNLCKLVKVTV